jgi:hypothetical protein
MKTILLSLGKFRSLSPISPLVFDLTSLSVWQRRLLMQADGLHIECNVFRFQPTLLVEGLHLKCLHCLVLCRLGANAISLILIAKGYNAQIKNLPKLFLNGSPMSAPPDIYI